MINIMTKQLKREVDSIVEQLVANYQPEKVILFGSAARGDATEESDVDLLVIKQTGETFHDRMVEARKNIQTDRPMDVIVYTPQEINRALAERRLFIRHVLKYGRTVYEARV